MKWLAVDYGDARTGLAGCDASETITSPITPQIEEKSMNKVAAAVVEVAAQRGAEGLVCGLPKNMDGIIINLPAYLAGLGEDAYLTEFIPSPDAEIVEEDTPSGDDFGMDDMTMDEVPVG